LSGYSNGRAAPEQHRDRHDDRLSGRRRHGSLVPALAVMLGANIGTALIVKALSFDVLWVAPLLLIAGYVAFRQGRKGTVHDLGRVGIGLGLMLLALHQLVVTIQPVETAPVLEALLGALTREPLLDLALAALLTWAAHFMATARRIGFSNKFHLITQTHR
jgi:Na+/phosphate symporter